MKKRFCVMLAILLCLNVLIVPTFATANTEDKMAGRTLSIGTVSDVRNVSISENDDGLSIVPIDGNPNVRKGKNTSVAYSLKNASDKERSIEWSIVSSPFRLSDIKVDGRSLSAIADEGIITLDSGTKVKIEFIFQVPLNYGSNTAKIEIYFYPDAVDTVGPKYEPTKDVNPYPEGSWPWYEQEMKKRGIYFA
ncbi:MAG: hypothetical protein PHG66_03210 [Candidatus Colwellbacteria bacterium]|nr:hypothetical protein [Candidatus Colwellbacteria bacterium]